MIDDVSLFDKLNIDCDDISSSAEYTNKLHTNELVETKNRLKQVEMDLTQSALISNSALISSTDQSVSQSSFVSNLLTIEEKFNSFKQNQYELLKQLHDGLTISLNNYSCFQYWYIYRCQSYKR